MPREPPRSSHSRHVKYPQLCRQVSYTKSKRCLKSIHSYIWSTECVYLDAGGGGGDSPKLPVRGDSARKGYLNFQASVI